MTYISLILLVVTEKNLTLTLKMPLNFLSAIYNGKISLKEAKFKQRDLEKEIEELQFYYIPKNKEEIKEIKRVLMHANELWESRNKTIKAFEDDIFLFEHLKKSDDTEEIKSMEEKINLSLFEEFFELSSPASYAKMLINIKNWNENKENVDEIKNRISDLEDRIKRMSEKEKKDKNADETLEIIEKTLDYNKDAQNYFHPASKVDKKKSEPRIEKGIADRVKLKNNKIA